MGIRTQNISCYILQHRMQAINVLCGQNPQLRIIIAGCTRNYIFIYSHISRTDATFGIETDTFIR
jgi:hypothetical protein